jgi:cell division protein FtsI/penicillin-binding protein 2
LQQKCQVITLYTQIQLILVLALTSLPGYNPNDFSTSQGLTEAQSKKYFNPDYEKMAKAQGKSQSLIDYMFPIDTKIKGNTSIRKDKFGRGDYAWYVGYAPATNPEIAISVVIFDGGYGSDAANVAKGMYESYLKNDPRMAKYKNNYDIKLKRIN